MTEQQIQAEKWLKRAVSSYTKAQIGFSQYPEIFLEDLCFDAQQAAEKALKAVLIFKNREVPKTHSIGFLISKIAECGYTITSELMEMAVLTDYAVQTRYPGEYDAVTIENYHYSIDLASRAIKFAKIIISQPNFFNIVDE